MFFFGECNNFLKHWNAASLLRWRCDADVEARGQGRRQGPSGEKFPKHLAGAEDVNVPVDVAYVPISATRSATSFVQLLGGHLGEGERRTREADRPRRQFGGGELGGGASCHHRGVADQPRGQLQALTLEPMAKKALSGDVEELKRARALRLEAERDAPMSERLARVHALSKQLSAIKGAAKAQ